MHKNTDDISLNNNFNDDILNTGKKGQKKKNKRKVSISPLTIVLLVQQSFLLLLIFFFLLLTTHAPNIQLHSLNQRILMLQKLLRKKIYLTLYVDSLKAVHRHFLYLRSCILITLYTLTGREIMFLLTLTLPLQKLITAHPDSHAMVMVL